MVVIDDPRGGVLLRVALDRFTRPSRGVEHQRDTMGAVVDEVQHADRTRGHANGRLHLVLRTTPRLLQRSRSTMARRAVPSLPAPGSRSESILADVMVGAAIEVANGLTGLRPPLLEPHAVMSLNADDQFSPPLPSIDFDKQKQCRQGTQAAQMIDYFAKHFGTKTS